MSHNNDEVTPKQTRMLFRSIKLHQNNFDLNKLPEENGIFLDSNKDVVDLNEVSFEGIDAALENGEPHERIDDVGLENEVPLRKIDVEIENEEVKKEIQDVLNIYLDVA
jgi:hypothetical protein